MRLRFFPLDFAYEDDVQDRAWIRIIGKTSEGKTVCVVDGCEAFFWLVPHKDVDMKSYLKKVEALQVRQARRECFVTRTEVCEKNFLGEEVKALKVYVHNPKDITYLKEAASDLAETDKKLEVDIGYVTRYLLEKKIIPLGLHEVTGRELSELEKENLNLDIDADILLKAEEIVLTEGEEFKPKVLAFDIEVSEFETGSGEILMVSLYGREVEKVITWKKFSGAAKQVEFVKDEEALLERFKEVVLEQKPDVLVGYFSDGFDMPYLRARADKCNIKLGLGLDSRNVEMIRGGVGSARLTGRVHVDLFKFVSNIISPILHTETLGLGDVASELIGEKKLDLDPDKISKGLRDGSLQETELRKFALYNLQDSALTFKLFEKLWPNIEELTRLVGQPLFNVSRFPYSQMVESYIMRNVEAYNEIIPNRPSNNKISERRRKGKFPGAYVHEPKFGLYDNVAVFDFAGLYPSMIVSFNIGGSTLTSSRVDAHETPEFEIDGQRRKFYFKKTGGFIPEILRGVLEKKAAVKSELRKKESPLLEARHYGLKTLGNATYGYYAFFGARWHCREGAASTTAFGRYYIQKVIDKIQKAGHKVIYGDTDSIMFELGQRTEKQVLNLLEELNKKLPGIMELELEDFYKRGLFVAKRTVKTGAKKKYALLSKRGKIKIRGFETVRRDWCALAKQVQRKVLESVLKEGKPDKALAYVKRVIAKIKNGGVKKNLLVIKTQLKKPIDSYETVGPHVHIAKRMHKLGIPVRMGTLIEYIVAKSKALKGRSTVRERAKLPEEVSEGDYDGSYYVERQILPAVENIFEVFSVEREELKGGQKKLGQFI